jgi:hypothetical protein
MEKNTTTAALLAAQWSSVSEEHLIMKYFNIGSEPE